MPDSPRVSVITPSFNQAPYLEQTIQSVLSQDYPNLEYIIVDGGSTDGSVDIIRRYADRLAYWVSEPDRGQAHAINKGLRVARGDILAWLNSDDLYNPAAVSQAVEALGARPHHALVYSNCHYIRSDGTLIQTVSAWDYSPRRILTGIPTVIQPASFFQRYALERVGPLNEELNYLIDHEFYVRMAIADLALCKVDAVWARFRLHIASKTHDHWVGFNHELQRVVERTFANASPGLNKAWQREARANVWQWLAEAYLQGGQRRQARAAALRAVLAQPLRAKTLMAMALWIDAALHTQLSPMLRHLRYRLPDAPGGAQPLMWAELRSNA